jgi:hypothetical protein
MQPLQLDVGNSATDAAARTLTGGSGGGSSLSLCSPPALGSSSPVLGPLQVPPTQASQCCDGTCLDPEGGGCSCCCDEEGGVGSAAGSDTDTMFVSDHRGICVDLVLFPATTTAGPTCGSTSGSGGPPPSLALPPPMQQQQGQQQQQRGAGFLRG